jgi:hypothetical protein
MIDFSPTLKFENLKLHSHKKRATILCVGVMSRNTVDAVIELSNEYDVPLVLIASRRQVEIDQFGGGYANNLSTAE